MLKNILYMSLRIFCIMHLIIMHFPISWWYEKLFHIYIPVFADIQRDRYMREHEWKVLRFKNYQIVSAVDKVVRKIEDVLDSSIS